ncbi:MAG TPA: hypothetical protein DIC34_00810 [Treponema sp.]|nr:hypothetical protein [Treponema sp.]
MSSLTGKTMGRPGREGNVLVQFSAFMFLVIVTAASVLGLVLSDFVRSHVIRMHGSFYALSLSPNFDDLLATGNGTEFEALKSGLESAGGLPHVKDLAVWDATGKQLFGPAGFHEGRTRDDPLPVALGGSVRFVYGTRPRAFSFGPPRGDLFLFLPIKDAAGRMKGVISLRESDSALAGDLDEAARTIALLVAIAGCAIYAALFLLYYRSYRRQRTAAERLRQSQESIIFAMSSLSGLRDQETGGHLERCKGYVRILATRLQSERQFRSYINNEYIRSLASIAPLHDIGKVGIDDAILRKPGKLTDEEYEAMKKHSELGAGILDAARERLSFPSQLELAVELTRHHHERWDGKGYPDGLAGEAIPLSARIMAIADVYDALRSERYYKKAMPHAEAIKVMKESAGSQFDPGIVSVFLANHSEFEAIFMDAAP